MDSLVWVSITANLTEELPQLRTSTRILKTLVIDYGRKNSILGGRWLWGREKWPFWADFEKLPKIGCLF
jgi:hypothetical protein